MPVTNRREAEIEEARDLCIEAQRLIDDALVIVAVITEIIDAVQRSVAGPIAADRERVQGLLTDSDE